MFRSSIVNCCKLSNTYFKPVILNKCNTRLIDSILAVRPCNVRFTSTDQVEEVKTDENIIYSGLLSRQLTAVKLFSLSSSAFGVIAQPILISKASALNSTPLLVGLCGIVGFFTFVTPLLLHFVTKKYAVKITYNQKTNKYVITTVSFFLREKSVEFTPDDVHIPDYLGMFTTCNIKGKPYFFEVKHFDDIKHYITIMGYDKPMDFKFSEAADGSESSSNKNSSQNKGN